MSIWACDGNNTRVEILNGAESNLITTQRLTSVGSCHWFLLQIISMFSHWSVVQSLPGSPDVCVFTWAQSNINFQVWNNLVTFTLAHVWIMRQQTCKRKLHGWFVFTFCVFCGCFMSLYCASLCGCLMCSCSHFALLLGHFVCLCGCVITHCNCFMSHCVLCLCGCFLLLHSHFAFLCSHFVSFCIYFIDFLTRQRIWRALRVPGQLCFCPDLFSNPSMYLPFLIIYIHCSRAGKLWNDAAVLFYLK